MSSKTFAITLNGVEYIMSAREVIDIAEVVTGITPSAAAYTGSAIKVNPESEKVLVEGTDYSITYSDNVSIGECEVTINGIGDYFGKTIYNLTIAPTDNGDTVESEEETEEIPVIADLEDSEEEILLEDTNSDDSVEEIIEESVEEPEITEDEELNEDNSESDVVEESETVEESIEAEDTTIESEELIEEPTEEIVEESIEDEDDITESTEDESIDITDEENTTDELVEESTEEAAEDTTIESTDEETVVDEKESEDEEPEEVNTESENDSE